MSKPEKKENAAMPASQSTVETKMLEKKCRVFLVAKGKAGFCLFISPLNKLVLCPPPPPPQFSLLLLLFPQRSYFQNTTGGNSFKYYPIWSHCPITLCLQKPFKETKHSLFFLFSFHLHSILQWDAFFLVVLVSARKRKGGRVAANMCLVPK